jgi:short-subunit dehydrogenase
VLRFDLRQHGIGVSLVCPGGVATPLTETVEIAGVDQTTAAFRRLQAHFRKRAVSPEQAAAAILRGMRRNRYLVYTSRDVRFAFLLQQVFPPGYVLLMRAMNVMLRRALPVKA